MEWIIIVVPIAMVILMTFFSSEDCLPAKRKLHNMLDDIRIYQNVYGDRNDTVIQHQGRTFKVRINRCTECVSYIRYDVYINDEKVLVYHVLEHCFSKSREADYCVDRLSYEVDEILRAAQKYTTKARNDKWKEKYNHKSYFN